MSDTIGEVAVAIYSAITDAIGPKLTRKANASLRAALAEPGLYEPEAASILQALCHDSDISEPEPAWLDELMKADLRTAH